jgi:hypothetical protein
MHDGYAWHGAQKEQGPLITKEIKWPLYEIKKIDSDYFGEE